MREQTVPPIFVTILDYILTAFCLHGFHPFSMNSVVPGGWTIAVETTFYFFAPILFFFITGWQRALAFLLGTLLIYRAFDSGLNYIYSHHLAWNDVSASVFGNYAYRWFPSQLPVFACGILTYFISRTLPSRFLTKQTGLLLMFTGVILIQAAVDIGDHGFIPIPEQLYYSIGFLFIFLALKCYPTKYLVNSFTQLLGRISYSGYLLHFAILLASLKMSHYYFPQLITHQTRQFILLFATTLAFTIPAAWLTYKFIEMPFISLGTRLVKYSESECLKEKVPILAPVEIVNKI